MKSILFLTLFFCYTTLAYSRTLEVGTGREFARIQNAAAQAQPGDTILIRGGIYSGGDYIENLQGTENAWITIRAADDEEVVFRGGSQAFHLTDPAYLRIEGLIFEEQTGNGVNIDDGGTSITPAHHLIIEHCQWRSMNATGNNDELKLSGVNEFTIRRCSFTNGSAGGSLIDMVGCHIGTFEENTFENGGSNSIQAKGGTSDIYIQRNKFRNGGQRAINIGGSTGLQFFRPIDATYEAKNIFVYSNAFMYGTAPIAFVGAVNCEVINNTILFPDRWTIRILQETVDTSRFLPCGNNTFRNNIVVTVSPQPVVNIGPNTAPETFTFSNNLWFNPDNSSWAPSLPVSEPDALVNVDPLLQDSLFNLSPNSPAVGKGYSVLQPAQDFYNRLFLNPPSIGAVEAGELTVESKPETTISITPNPTTEIINIIINKSNVSLTIIDMQGVVLWRDVIDSEVTIDVSSWPAGAYLVQWDGRSRILIKE